MRGHDQSEVRGRRNARAWLLRLALPLALASVGAPAGAWDVVEASWKGDEAEPIRLKADRLQTWSDGPAEWTILEDQVEVRQGGVSIRADRGVARVVRAGRADGSIYRVELYVEGQVRDPADPGRTWPEIRTAMVSKQPVGREARVPRGRVALAKAPKGLPLLAHAGLGAGPVETSSRQPAPTPIDVPSPPIGPAAVAAVAAAGAPPGLPPAPSLRPDPTAKVDPAVVPAQLPDLPAFPDDFTARPLPEPPPAPAADQPPTAPNSAPLGPSFEPPVVDNPPTNLQPLPDAAPRLPAGMENSGMSPAPVLVGSQRVTRIYPRGLGQIQFQSMDVLPDGTQILVIRNGVNIQTQSKEQGIVDVEADSVVIWRRASKDGPPRLDMNNQLIENVTDPLEFYLEGHVIFRQDQLIYQGKGDQRTYQAKRLYYDVRKDQLLALDAQVDLYSPGLTTPAKVTSPRILQYHPFKTAPNGQVFPSSLAAIQADRTVTTGSRFANPGYRFTSRSMDIEQVVDNKELAKATNGQPTDFDKDDLTWLIDARQNFFFMGPIPVFYQPHVRVEADDLNPALTTVAFATNNFFGQQFRTTFDVFNLLNQRHPPEIDIWNLNVDYLSARDTKPGQGIALGTSIGWYGQDLINDLNDPYHKLKNVRPSFLTNYGGYFDIFGLLDGSRDVLGGGPAVITDSPNNNEDGRAGFTRLSNPFYRELRGIVTARHMQSFDQPDTPIDEDYRLNLEVGFFSDRNFEEQYFKRRFDTGLDQENLAYFIGQRQNRAVTLLAETNLQTFQTETQWYPKLDDYSLGDSLLGNRLTYYGHTGVDYANVHTAAEVNNRTIFSYLPIDPISNTNGTFQSGRLYSAQELDLPISGQFGRITPYVQGQAVGWNNQIGGHSVGRIWGAFGARGDVTLWQAFPNVESELLNIHGLNHKIDFVADYRNAYSNVPLNSIGVQDDLDDNSYEYTRRYFALTNYIGGILPPMYDPRFLLLRRGLSPITGSTDVQATIQYLKLGIHQRLQTKRGTEGRRHIMDYMTLDLDTTYFPEASRDNFGKPFGQNMYNYEWYIGDRTSIVSYGWFEFWKVTGQPYLNYNTSLVKNDPFGLQIITSGVSITRIPKGNIFIGYSIVNTGPISTSALNTQYSYWLSPKWFGTVAESYDFGNGILLGASGSLTRIGKDYLSSVGLAVSPLQHSYQFVFTVSPRLSPNMQFGSATGVTRLDSRFQPVD